MTEHGHADSFRDLAVYQRARSVTSEIFRLSKLFPKEETYSLTDQIRRSSRSIGAQIAEAWGKRRYGKHFVSKLTDAGSEELETEHWVEIARECGYVSQEQFEQLMANLEAVGRMLSAMVQKSHLFCAVRSDRVREDIADYLA